MAASLRRFSSMAFKRRSILALQEHTLASQHGVCLCRAFSIAFCRLLSCRSASSLSLIFFLGLTAAARYEHNFFQALASLLPHDACVEGLYTGPDGLQEQPCHALPAAASLPLGSSRQPWSADTPAHQAHQAHSSCKRDLQCESMK